MEPDDKTPSPIIGWIAAGTGALPLIAGAVVVLVVILVVLHAVTGFGAQPTSAQLEKTFGPLRGPAMVDFYADWCGPCQHQSPIIDSLANSYAGRVTFLRVNVDNHPHLAQAYGVSAIPALMVFKNGKRTWHTVGLTQEPKLRAVLDKTLASP